MKNFSLTPGMQTMGGVFYPKGYVFIMFANLQDAEQVANAVDSALEQDGTVMLLSPETILATIGKEHAKSDLELPPVGTESATVRKYVDLAHEGHHALMVKVNSDADVNRVMSAARKVRFSYGQRYHLLAMEDLE
ncbi:MAG: RNA-binding protein [Pseudomonadota bacterium]